MHRYEYNQRMLSALRQGREYVRIENPPNMLLTVETIPGTDLVSLCQFGKCNGDYMRNPEIYFWTEETTVGEGPTSRTVLGARPVYCRNDYLSYHVATVKSQLFHGVPVDPAKQQVLDNFCRLWWMNITEQGYLEKAKTLAAEQRRHEQEADPDLDPGPDMET